MDDSTRRNAEQEEIDEQELRRRLYLARLSDWSEPGAVKVYRDGKLVGPPVESDRVELRKRIFKLP